MKTILIVVLVTNVAMLAMSASLLDAMTTSADRSVVGRDADAADISNISMPLSPSNAASPSSSSSSSSSSASSSSAGEPKRNCLCNGPSCICCVDFNISFIDLGGPGCVRMNYISADAGIAINVSYGDSLLHSQTVKGPDPAPTCLNIFSGIAQMCARFTHLLPTDDGLRGCVILEPKLLATTQIELTIGCFRMGPRGMEISESSADIIKEQLPGVQNAAGPAGDADDEDEDETGPPSTIAGYNTADLLAVVTDSAEQGIALLSSWLGLSTATTAAEETSATGDDETYSFSEADFEAAYGEDSTTPSTEDWQNADESVTSLPPQADDVQ